MAKADLRWTHLHSKCAVAVNKPQQFFVDSWNNSVHHEGRARSPLPRGAVVQLAWSASVSARVCSRKLTSVIYFCIFFIERRSVAPHNLFHWPVKTHRKAPLFQLFLSAEGLFSPVFEVIINRSTTVGSTINKKKIYAVSSSVRKTTHCSDEAKNGLLKAKLIVIPAIRNCFKTSGITRIMYGECILVNRNQRSPLINLCRESINTKV